MDSPRACDEDYRRHAPSARTVPRAPCVVLAADRPAGPGRPAGLGHSGRLRDPGLLRSFPRVEAQSSVARMCRRAAGRIQPPPYRVGSNLPSLAVQPLSAEAKHRPARYTEILVDVALAPIDVAAHRPRGTAGVRIGAAPIEDDVGVPLAAEYAPQLLVAVRLPPGDDDEEPH